MSQEAPTTQRIDKWLWHARFARTRGAAQDLVHAGHVRVNREKAKSASKPVRTGDVLTLALGRGVLVVRVSAIVERRVSVQAAAALYQLESPTQDHAQMPAMERSGSSSQDSSLE